METRKRKNNSSHETAAQLNASKREIDEKIVDTPETSAFHPLFMAFRDELDEHHDRRERVFKAARDITANSKKVIFALQRLLVIVNSLKRAPVDSLGKPISAQIQKSIDPLLKTINDLLESITVDLTGINAWRYQRQISPGIQEYMEAVAFRHYLTTQKLITHDEAQTLLPRGIVLTEEDWTLGVFDVVGEIMRWSITGIATSGRLAGTDNKAGGQERNVLGDLREMRVMLEGINSTGSGFNKEVEKKMSVMKTCVAKVENAAYGLAIRGSERPQGWVPEVEDGVYVENY